MRDFVTLQVNGRLFHIKGDDAFLMLSDYLRLNLELCGSKVVCAEGDCGACTVLFLRKDAQDQHDYLAINACIAPLFLLDGGSIITVEALSEGKNPHPVQEAILCHHATQCGFCTPGFVMALAGFFQKKREKLCAQKVKNAMTGNLCRCTGYQPLINAALSLNKSEISSLKKRFPLLNNIKNNESILIQGSSSQLFAPQSLQEALTWLQDYPETKISSGASDIGVLINKKNLKLERILSINLIQDLAELSIKEDRVTVGARVTLQELRSLLKSRCAQLARFIDLFASPQIKNMASLVGNIANASPIADSLPFLMVLDAEVHCKSIQHERRIALKNLFKSYKSLSLEPSEIISHVSFRLPKEDENFAFYKISQRRDLDIATVNSAFLFKIAQGCVLDARIAYGGLHETVLRMRSAEDFLRGKELNQENCHTAMAKILQEVSPISDLRGSKEYRKALAISLFERFMAEEMRFIYA
jgi:xanthine dehydrogenase small subunit